MFGTLGSQAGNKVLIAVFSSAGVNTTVVICIRKCPGSGLQGANVKSDSSLFDVLSIGPAQAIREEWKIQKSKKEKRKK